MIEPIIATAKDAEEFIHHVRELCEKYNMTLVAQNRGAFELGLVALSMPKSGEPNGVKIGTVRHISPWFAEMDRCDGIFRQIK
jgi:hypothetical protein